MKRQFTAWIQIAVGAAVGIFSGFFGVGGGVIAVPALVFFAYFSQKRAHATSLVVVGMVALTGSVIYALSGDVEWGPVVALVAGGLVGSQVGAWILTRISDRFLTLGFAVFLGIVAVRLLVADPPPEDAMAAGGPGAFALYAAIGLVAGILSGLLGTGGGVIMIPALVLIGGFSQHTAEGTSLAAMVFIAFAGGARLAREGYSDVRQGARIGLAGMVTAPLGALLALSLDAVVLQRFFAILLLVVAAQLVATRLNSHSP